jgi:hypothetical protein
MTLVTSCTWIIQFLAPVNCTVKGYLVGYGMMAVIIKGPGIMTRCTGTAVGCNHVNGIRTTIGCNTSNCTVDSMAGGAGIVDLVVSTVDKRINLTGTEITGCRMTGISTGGQVGYLGCMINGSGTIMDRGPG